MPTPLSPKSSKRVLEPMDRVSEVLFGLIMVLTFTGSLSVADAGRDDVRAMLIGALGCNFAWAIIDGMFYLMNSLSDIGRSLATLKAVRAAPTADEARAIIVKELPPIVAEAMETAEVDAIAARLKGLPPPPERARLGFDDFRGAAGVFLLVFLTTFPVAVPFMLVPNVLDAMRISNAIAVVMLFIAGFAHGRIAGRSPWLFGAGMVVLGLIVVTFTIALGG